jgi:hypothetical protein
MTVFDPPGCLTYELRSGLPLRDYSGRIERRNMSATWRSPPRVPLAANL